VQDVHKGQRGCYWNGTPMAKQGEGPPRKLKRRATSPVGRDQDPPSEGLKRWLVDIILFTLYDLASFSRSIAIVAGA